MKLEYPLNDALPNIQHARDRLLARIFHYRLETESSLHTTDSDYALLYAYGRFFSDGKHAETLLTWAQQSWLQGN